MLIGARIRERMEALGLSQSELARRVGVTQGTIAKLVNGQNSGTTYVHRLARELKTTVEYLSGETDDPDVGAFVPTRSEIAEHFDLVGIASIDASYGMGVAFIDLLPEDVTTQYFPRTWLESITYSPAEELFWARGRGDSMAPTIGHNDILLIDRSQRSISEPDAIWALMVGDQGMVKRLRLKGERVIILSDNDKVPPDEAHHEEVVIVGRVVFIGRRM